jgi:flagellar assembly protein FliH
MSNIGAKFTFDTEFRSEGDLVSNAARARQKKSYAQDEIDALCARARAEGAKAGQVRAQEAVAAATDELAQTLRTALAQSHADIELVRAEAATIAFAVAKKLSRAAIASAPASEVETALREAIHQAIGEPRIVLRASPAVVRELEPMAAAIAGDEGFDGRLVLSADPRQEVADCRIEWRGAGAEHVQDAIEGALAALIARRFPTHSSED